MVPVMQTALGLSPMELSRNVYTVEVLSSISECFLQFPQRFGRWSNRELYRNNIVFKSCREMALNPYFKNNPAPVN